ncbi:MAG: dephospho-CoA kinase [Endomicrobia bacterium]|nr:dephospho-CoA kinase [Endomicrobiia bacterium]MDW8055199.1 dephospho-CoA kinase [Elusimicrobiota bacterium]
MKTIGLTGHIATGKTTALKFFKKLGCITLSCDDIYHRLLSKEKKLISKLVAKFGSDVLTNGKVSRKKLYEKILANPSNLNVLEKITHPFILNEIFTKIKQYRKKYKNKLCIVDVPLLFEKKLQKKFDFVITIYCSKKIQKERLKKRKVDRNIIKLLLDRQLPISTKIKLSNFVINNNGTKKKLKQQVNKIFKVLNMAQDVICKRKNS